MLFFLMLIFQSQDSIFITTDMGSTFYAKMNPNLMTKMQLQVKSGIDGEFNIAFSKEWIKRYKDEKFNQLLHVPVFYVVKKGDTIYSISNNFFRIPEETLIRRNQLYSKDLQPGQNLLIGWVEAAPLGKRTIAIVHDLKSWEKDWMIINGTVFQSPSKKMNAQNYALSNKYPVGTLIKIYNPLSKVMMDIQIIDGFPLSIYDDSISIVVSEKTAKVLGAKDTKFFIKILTPRKNGIR
jgi:ABC-type molybdate transport system substrate-binding protein